MSRFCVYVPFGYIDLYVDLIVSSANHFDIVPVVMEADLQTTVSFTCLLPCGPAYDNLVMFSALYALRLNITIFLMLRQAHLKVPASFLSTSRSAGVSAAASRRPAKD